MVAAWINQICPVVEPALSLQGTLTFRNAAIDANAATAPEHYTLRWFRFDNATDQRTPVGEATIVERDTARAPDGALLGEFVGVSVTASHPRHAGWAAPSTFFFRRGRPGGWSLVGVERGSGSGSGS